MTDPSVQVAQANVAKELPAARAWADRNRLSISWEEEELALCLRLEGPGRNAGTIERYLLVGRFDEYKALPPAWTFVHPDTEEPLGPPAFPRSTKGYRRSGLFINSGREGAVICAPFNRLAFKQEDGPHEDWGAPSNWENAARSGQVHATEIGPMLSVIHQVVGRSAGRMEPLP